MANEAIPIDDLRTPSLFDRWTILPLSMVFDHDESIGWLGKSWNYKPWCALYPIVWPLVTHKNGHETMTAAMDPEKRRKLSLVLQRLYLMKAPKAWVMGEHSGSGRRNI